MVFWFDAWSPVEQMQMTDHDALPELSADHLWFFTTNLITRFCYLVTAGHEHVGTVPVYAQDVSFPAFQWPKGTTCGTKQTAITSATLMAFTSLPMPMLLTEPGSGGDWTHLFLGPLQISGRKVGQLGIVPTAVRTAFANYQRELKYMARQCDAFNEQALGSDYAGARRHDRRAPPNASCAARRMRGRGARPPWRPPPCTAVLAQARRSTCLRSTRACCHARCVSCARAANERPGASRAAFRTASACGRPTPSSLRRR
jgi:hypothetical protein